MVKINDDLLIKSLTIDWSRISSESYLCKIPAIGSLTDLQFSSPVTCFVGENGTGKSTLLEALAISAGFNPEGGNRNYRFSTYDSHSELHSAVKLARGYTDRNTVIFSEPRRIMRLQFRRSTTAVNRAAIRSICVNAHTARAF